MNYKSVSHSYCIKEIDGKKCEPIEELTIVYQNTFKGRAVEFVTMRKVNVSIGTKGDV
jgi:GTP-binding protein